MGKHDKNQQVESEQSTVPVSVTIESKELAVVPTKEAEPKPRYKPANVKIGLINRTKYNLTITFLKEKLTETVMLAPAGRTKKEFIEYNIQAINGIPLAEAHRKGLVSIIR